MVMIRRTTVDSLKCKSPPTQTLSFYNNDILPPLLHLHPSSWQKSLFLENVEFVQLFCWTTINVFAGSLSSWTPAALMEWPHLNKWGGCAFCFAVVSLKAPKAYREMEQRLCIVNQHHSSGWVLIQQTFIQLVPGDFDGPFLLAHKNILFSELLCRNEWANLLEFELML